MRFQGFSCSHPDPSREGRVTDASATLVVIVGSGDPNSGLQTVLLSGPSP